MNTSIHVLLNFWTGASTFDPPMILSYGKRAATPMRGLAAVSPQRGMVAEQTQRGLKVEVLD